MLRRKGVHHMKLCKYWAMAEGTGEDAAGQKLALRKWGGSNASLAEAKSEAERMLRDLQSRLRDIKTQGWDKGYSYSLRDVPEELVTSINEQSGITRNGKGCLVLNTTEAMFVDIDLPPVGFFAKLFGGSREKQEQQALADLRQWLEARPDFSVRVYRTRAGLRYLFTHAPMAVSEETLGWLQELKSDKLYVTMCRNQKCYRARLTPKPYRLRCGQPPGHYPYDDGAAQDKFASWKSVYEEQSNEVATCALIDTLGTGRIDASLTRLVELHDRHTKVSTNLPLA